METETKILLRFYSLEVTYWLSFGSFTAYAGAFVLSKGMSPSMLSVMLAGYMLCAFFGQFFWGSLCDQLNTNKKIFRIGNLLLLLLYVCIYFSSSLTLTIVLYGMLGFVQPPLASNLDTWLLKSFRHRPQVYGPARGCASLGFALFMLGFGYLIQQQGFYVMPISAFFFIMMNLLISSFIPDSPKLVSGSKMSVKDIGALSKVPRYVFLLIVLFFLGFAISPLNNLKIILLTRVGGNISNQGFDSFIACFSQFPFFFLAGKLSRFKVNHRLLLCSILPLCSMIITFLAVSPTMVIIGSVITAISYGILLPTTREIVIKNVSASLQTTGHGVSDAIYGSFSGVLSLVMVGQIIDNYGIKIVLLICMTLQSVAIVMVTLKVRKSQTVAHLNESFVSSQSVQTDTILLKTADTILAEGNMIT